MIGIVAAYTENRVIGKSNDLPWHLPADMKHFRSVTSGGTVIMGRKTFESVYKRTGKPLSNRRNMVLSSSLKTVPKGFEVYQTLDQALDKCDGLNPDNEVFIIGGEQLFKSALDDDVADHMYLTEIHAVIEGDSFFPEFNSEDWLQISRKRYSRDESNPYDYSFVLYLRN